MWCVLKDIRGTTRHVHLMLPITLPYTIPKYKTHYVTQENKPQLHTTEKFLI